MISRMDNKPVSVITAFALRCPFLAHSGHSRHCNILSAIGQERTLTINTPDRISVRPPQGGVTFLIEERRTIPRFHFHPSTRRLGLRCEWPCGQMVVADRQISEPLRVSQKNCSQYQTRQCPLRVIGLITSIFPDRV